MFQQLTRPFSAEVSLGIGGEILAWLGQCEGFDELVVVEKVIRFFRTPSGSNVFNRGADENQGALLFIETFEGELIDESLSVELAQHEFLCSGIVANKADLFMSFSLRILLLGRVNGLIRDLDEAIAEGKAISPFRISRSGFTIDVAFPCSKKLPQRAPDISFSWARFATERECRGD